MAQARAERPGSVSASVGRRLVGSGHEDAIFRGAVTGLSALAIIILVAVIALLIRDAWPAIERYGFGFITTSVWDPVQERFGAWPYVYGTLFSSLLSLLIATPVAVGSALFLAEYALKWLRDPVSFLVELLAAIPSIIYGL